MRELVAGVLDEVENAVQKRYFRLCRLCHGNLYMTYNLQFLKHRKVSIPFYGINCKLAP